MRAAYRKRKREAAEKWHEGEAKGEKNWSAERRRRGEERGEGAELCLIGKDSLSAICDPYKTRREEGEEGG